MSRVGRTIRHELGYWALRALLAAARLVPLPLLRGLGELAGAVALRVAASDLARAREHLSLAFPDATEAWREGVLRASAASLGRILGEVAWLWSATRDRILSRSRFEGLEHLTGSITPERGAVVITAHCGNWEWLNLALGAAGVPMTVVAREVYDPRLDSIAQRLRGRFGGATQLRSDVAGRRLVAALRRGRSLGLLIDQDIDTPGVFVEFFGRPAWTPSGAAVLALRLRAPVIATFAVREADGTMRLIFDPPIEPTPSEDLDADAGRLTARLTARIEAHLRAHPDQWVWMHRRWQRQPAPGDRVYHPNGSIDTVPPASP